MLIADISINRKKLLEQIYIHRVDGTPPGNCKYVIKMPKGYSDKVFTHKYSDGYLPLLCRCLNYIKREQKRLTDKWNINKI
jgi:hypothetical protein